MNDTKQKTCVELIYSELADREEQIAEIFAKIDSEDSEKNDEGYQDLSEFDYGVSVYSVARVTWSGGGPADFIEITYDKHDLIKVEYIYQDWYDGARVAVEEGSAVYRYAENILEGADA